VIKVNRYDIRFSNDIQSCVLQIKSFHLPFLYLYNESEYFFYQGGAGFPGNPGRQGEQGSRVRIIVLFKVVFY
jgi:hypothetical protein